VSEINGRNNTATGFFQREGRKKGGEKEVPFHINSRRTQERKGHLDRKEAGRNSGNWKQEGRFKEEEKHLPLTKKAPLF